MLVTTTKTFTKNYSKIPNYIQEDITAFYRELIDLPDLRGIKNIKKLTGFKDYYRFKIGDYRVGFSYLNGSVLLITVLHRKDIYKFFP
ncbi:MAG: type II toxin-antitoxin system RelE family toxin [Bacteroidota bacterium]